MTAFATVSDLVARWRPLSTEEAARATVLLDDASAIIRSESPTVDALITAGTISADIVRMVACGMVKRAMIANEAGEGVSTAQETVGPFAHSFTYSNPMGNVYLTKADRRMVGVATGRAFTIDTAPTDSGVSIVTSAEDWDYL